MGDGCPEKVGLPFLRWILTFRGRKRPHLMRKLQALPATTEVVILRNPRQVRHFLAALEEEASRTREDGA